MVDVFFDDFEISHTKSPIISADDYYPFGLQISQNAYQRESAVDQNYKYNGKELQDELGLNWHDYGARMYDASIGRWYVVDPLSEKYQMIGPYTYGLDNPIYFYDPDGRDVREKTTKYGQDKEGNEIKLRKISFRKVTRIEREIEVTNFQVVDKTGENATDEQISEASDLIKEEIIDTWSGSSTDNKGRTIDLKISITEEKIDENDTPVVFEIVNSEDIKTGIGETDRLTGVAKIEKSFGYLGNILNGEKVDRVNSFGSGRVASHEFGHQGTLGHKSGTIMDKYGGCHGSRAPSFKQRKRLFKGRKKIRKKN